MTQVNESNAAERAQQTRAGRSADPGPSTVRRSATIGKLAAAMVRVQADIEDPKKNKRADAGSKVYRYADLVTVLDALRPAWKEHNIAVFQLLADLDGHSALTTLVTHADGEWIESTVKMFPVKTDPQSVGSAISYYRRYALLALFAVAQDDDDGKAASTPAATHQAATRQQRPPGDNPVRRAEALEAIRRCGDRPAMSDIMAQIKHDADAGHLSPADQEALRAACQEWLTAHPAPAKQPAPAK